MRVRMLATVQGSEDGIHLRELIGGQEYNLAPHLSSILIEGELALEVVATEARAEVETPKPAATKPAAKRKNKRTGPKENKKK